METGFHIEKNENRDYKKILTIALIGLLLVLAGYGAFVFYKKMVFLNMRSDAAYVEQDDNAYFSSLTGDDPSLLKNQLINDIENGVNDKFTKSDMYFITHRYFDNGGNIYEIYDYVNSHENLVFLKEAEDIYPGIFEQIEKRALRPTSSVPAKLALLAYMEVVDRYGYADIALLGTAANQYAKIANFAKSNAEMSGASADKISPLGEMSARKAVFFEFKAKENLVQLFQKKGYALEDIKKRPLFIGETTFGDEILNRDLLVGLNQYAATLRYLEAARVDTSVINSPLSAEDVFSFNMLFSKQFVPELEIFSGFLNASTLSLVAPSNIDGMRTALQPIFNLGVVKKPTDLVKKIIKSKLEVAIYFSGTHVRNFDLDIYGVKNVVTLANIVPEFKAWLKANKWKESDFQLN